MDGDAKAPLRLVVLGDSLAFTDARAPQLPSDPALYPNVAARTIEAALLRPVTVNVLARAGSDVRDAWKLVFKDRHVQFELLMGADAVIVAVGSFDHAPAGVPPVLEAVIPFLHPAPVRRRARALLRSIHPWGVRATAGRFARTPWSEFERLYGAILHQVRSLAAGSAGVVLAPTSHRSAYYGNVHPQRVARERGQIAIAEHHGYPVVRSWPLVQPFTDRLNPDGIHWPTEAHAAIGRALGEQLAAQLLDDAPRPPAPWA